jgi:hypothetical protein
MKNLEQQYNELAYYTLGLHDKSFIHQHVVDAYTAQTADKETKPIAITFALVGLYLGVEKGYTGREVQLFHMLMAKNKKEWPRIILPVQRGDITVKDVLAVPPGKERNEMIHTWSVAVWEAFNCNRDIIIGLIDEFKPFTHEMR